ncbi:MAG: glycosyltransferase [Halioglobus sp.]
MSSTSSAGAEAPWCVFQIGAREHYAIARAIHSKGVRCNLFTDYWAANSGMLPVPAPLRQRTHPAFKGIKVNSFNPRYLVFEAAQRARRHHSWQHIESRNAWFQKVACKAFASYLEKCDSPPVVFAYSYAALEILKLANSFGCKTILGQIDPGPAEFSLVEELHKRAGYPLPEQPSAHYWESWRKECDIADTIIVNSPWSKSALLEQGVAQWKLEVVPLVYEAEKPHSSDDDSPRQPLKVLYLGQVILRKGILELADAISAMKDRPVQWTIVGGGEPSLMDKLRDLPQTEVIGPVSRAEVVRFYQDADVFILPTHSDGYALTQLEAAAHGLPIIASKNCGEVVEPGVTGLVLEEISANGIITAVMELIEHPDKLNHYKQNTRVKERSKLESLGEKLVQIAAA